MAVSSSEGEVGRSLLKQLEKIQLNYGLAYDQKEAGIASVLSSVFVIAESSGDLCRLLLKCRQSTAPVDYARLMQILEQYPKVYADILQSEALEPLLSCLDASDSDAESAAANILSMMHITLQELLKIGRGCPDGALPPASLTAIATFALHLVAAVNLSLSERASSLLNDLAPLDYRQIFVVMQTVFTSLAREDTTTRLRYLALAVALASRSEDALVLAIESGIIDDVFQMCRMNDILVQINAIELLIPIAGTTAGLDLMCSRGLLSWLIKGACGVEGILERDTTSDPLLASEAIRTIAAIFEKAARHSFQFVDKLDPAFIQRFLSALLQRLDDGNEVDKITCKTPTSRPPAL